MPKNSFSIVESPMKELELEAKYPEIKNYSDAEVCERFLYLNVIQGKKYTKTNYRIV